MRPPQYRGANPIVKDAIRALQQILDGDRDQLAADEPSAR